MRITESRMTELAATRTGAARERVARAGAELSSGVRVLRPSDDPAAWAGAERARIRQSVSEARGGSIATSSERAAAADNALAILGDIVSRSRELAVQALNSSISPEARNAIAAEVRALAGSALAAANETANDGQFLFAGSRGETAPFDITGTYVGDAIAAEIETAPTSKQVIALDGTALTAANGVNVLAELQNFATALENNNLGGIQASIGALDSGVEQVSRARATIGALSASLALADEARGGLELQLAESIARGVEVDAITAASDLAAATQSLEVAQAVTQRIIDTTRSF